ncbi:alcohol dehydrogenase catalytic domain-containing protein [bacterium]|nr:alcohol dehydrogenase catalytic domain-containing protein [bacterium]
MKALCLYNRLELLEVEEPTPRDNEVLVRIAMAGICNTDLEIVKGYVGFQGVLGHEFVGVVEETGKRVCGEINFGCDKCEWCARDMRRHCPNRSVLGILNQPGAFAEFAAVPLDNLREVPDSISDSAAVFVEPLAASFEILEQVQIEPRHQVAVLGDGKLGLLIAQVLKLTGCELHLFGKHASKLAIAESFGIKTTAVQELPDSDYDVVVEASGSPSGFSAALKLVRPRGAIVLKSTYDGNLELDAAPIVIDEITVVGSRCGRFEPAIRALTQDLIHVEPLIDDVYPFDQALEAFERAQEKDSLKVLLDFGN